MWAFFVLIIPNLRIAEGNMSILILIQKPQITRQHFKLETFWKEWSGVVHKWRHAISDIFWLRPPSHCHAFYDQGLSSIFINFEPSPFRSWRHLWTHPNLLLLTCATPWMIVCSPHFSELESLLRSISTYRWCESVSSMWAWTNKRSKLLKIMN